MFTVVAAIEAYGLFSVYKVRSQELSRGQVADFLITLLRFAFQASPKLLRTFSFLSIGASILAITASILAFIFNFIFKVVSRAFGSDLRSRTELTIHPMCLPCSPTYSLPVKQRQRPGASLSGPAGGGTTTRTRR